MTRVRALARALRAKKGAKIGQYSIDKTQKRGIINTLIINWLIIFTEDDFVQENTLIQQEEQDRARAVIKQFVRADRLHRQAVEATITSQTGLHRSQHMLLMRLSRGCIPSQKQLAKELSVSPAAIAVSLKKLETDGYITKDADADDCRCNRIALTEKGQCAINQTKKLFASIDNAMVQGFDDAELDALMSALSRIEQNLHNMLEQTQTTHGKEDTL